MTKSFECVGKEQSDASQTTATDLKVKGEGRTIRYGVVMGDGRP
jgi:hypothetical protein